jgi:hypothetical protein
MHVRYLPVLFVAAIAVGATSAHAQTAGPAVLVPGLWEITVQTRSPIVGPVLTHTVCIDKWHVTRPEPPKTKSADDCQVSPDSAAANETAYTIRCTKRKITSTSRFTYSGDHFDGIVTIKTGDEDVRQVYTAVRIGACDDLPADSTPTPPAH